MKTRKKIADTQLENQYYSLEDQESVLYEYMWAHKDKAPQVVVDALREKLRKIDDKKQHIISKVSA